MLKIKQKRVIANTIYIGGNRGNFNIEKMNNYIAS